MNSPDVDFARQFLADMERTLAADWRTATNDFAASDLVTRYFGASFKDAMLAIKRFEQDEFNRTITPFEYDTYLICS